LPLKVTVPFKGARPLYLSGRGSPMR
jgi:hypothetical protein